MSNNPYEPAIEPEFRQTGRQSLWRFTLHSVLLGLVYGMISGAVAAALVALAVTWFAKNFSIGLGDLGSPVTNALVSSIAGAIFGGSTYSAASAFLGLVASRVRPTIQLLPVSSALLCGGFGAVGGLACGCLLSGTGFDGVPFSFPVLALSGFIGLFVGLVGGTMHGMHLSRITRPLAE